MGGAWWNFRLVDGHWLSGSGSLRSLAPGCCLGYTVPIYLLSPRHVRALNVDPFQIPGFRKLGGPFLSGTYSKDHSIVGFYIGHPRYGRPQCPHYLTQGHSSLGKNQRVHPCLICSSIFPTKGTCSTVTPGLLGFRVLRGLGLWV